MIEPDVQATKKTDKLELKLVEDEISKRTQNQLKDFAKHNPEIKPKNNLENKNDRPSY
nr:hypothetical protein [Lactiplantibacillus plantarum]